MRWTQYKIKFSRSSLWIWYISQIRMFWRLNRTENGFNRTFILMREIFAGVFLAQITMQILRTYSFRRIILIFLETLSVGFCKSLVIDLENSIRSCVQVSTSLVRIIYETIFRTIPGPRTQPAVFIVCFTNFIHLPCFA